MSCRDCTGKYQINMVITEDCCQNCGKVKTSFYQCSQCKVISYCSKKCVRMHKNEHEKVCSTLQTTQDQKLNSSLAEPKETCSKKHTKPAEELISKSSPCDEAESFCQTCYRTNVALQKCSKCKSVYYCSPKCQKIDWQTHRNHCKNLKLNTEENCEKNTDHEFSDQERSTKGPVTENCVSVDVEDSGKTDKVNDKNKAKKENSKNGQIKKNCDNTEKEEVNSKVDMNEISQKDSDTEACKDNNEIINCKDKNGKMDSEKDTIEKDTSQKETRQENIKSDFKEIETINSGKKTDAGTSVQITTFETIKCEKCGDCNENLKTCSQCKIAKYCSKDCQESAWKLHKKFCKSPNSLNTTPSRRQVHFIKSFIFARGLFPLHRLVTRFIEVQVKFPWDKWTDKTLLFAYISKPGYHASRPSVFIEDSVGCMMILIFHHKESDPFPYFSWSQLKIGNYICILEPKCQYFSDGQVGFRVNSTQEIRII